MKLDDKDLGMWLGGLLSAIVLQRAHELAERDTGGPSWKDGREAYATAAFEEVTAYFPEPLRAKLRDDRATFIASFMGLN